MRTLSAPLADLLRSLFDPDQLRIFLYEVGGPDLVDALPGHASHVVLSHEAALALARHGHLDAALFDRLAAARPHRRADIQAARAAWFVASRPASGLVLGGRYRLDAQLGEGGVASVWRAVDERTGQIVAVKLLHPRHEDDARVRRRFFRGASALTTLAHPAIVRVLAALEEDGRRCFYVMEYVPGVTLEVCVRERRYPTDVLLALALKIGDALAHVHARGLLHRDVKPANILVVDRDTARLIDFDLITGEDFVAQTTQAVGTGIYMPPEAHTADRKTAAYDVYSLARTIEFVLRGRDPSARELFDVTGLPGTAEVRGILRAALATDPGRRIAGVATFCAALRAALDPARRAPPPGPSPAADEPDVPAAPPPYRAAAIASIVGHLVAIGAAQPPGNAVPLLALLIAPSARVLLDREDYKLVTLLHWLCLALWCLLTFALLASLFDTHPTSKLKPLPTLVLLAALAVGAYASVTYLLRPRPAR